MVVKIGNLSLINQKMKHKNNVLAYAITTNGTITMTIFETFPRFARDEQKNKTETINSLPYKVFAA